MKLYWSGELLAAVSQDYLCNEIALNATGLDIKTHQQLTILRYDRLMEDIKQEFVEQRKRWLYAQLAADLDEDFNDTELEEVLAEEAEPPYLMPTLQGQSPTDYLSHLEQYGNRLSPGQWVGVGSLLGRYPGAIEEILIAIHQRRPDLKLHGFGIKKKALQSGIIHTLLHSADSQAHGFKQAGETGQKFKGTNHPERAINYLQQLQTQPLQLSLFPVIHPLHNLKSEKSPTT